MKLTLRQATTLSQRLDMEYFYDAGHEKGYTRAQVDAMMRPAKPLSKGQRNAMQADLHGKGVSNGQV